MVEERRIERLSSVLFDRMHSKSIINERLNGARTKFAKDFSSPHSFFILFLRRCKKETNSVDLRLSKFPRFESGLE